MALTSASVTDFDAFLSQYGYTVSGDKAQLLALSFAFLRSLPFCDSDQATNADIIEAQGFIAYAMSVEGGGFNPAGMVDNRTLTKEGIGRNALVEEWEVNDALSGTDAYTLIKRLPIAYGLLSQYLCGVDTNADGSTTHIASVFVV